MAAYKKSAGQSLREILSPYYVQVDRSKRPKCFISASPDEYNDILNNYRTPLGEYDFKRSLFAKKYLYPSQWDNMFTFAFSKEPISRAVSMFFYLHYKPNLLDRIIIYAEKFGFIQEAKSFNKHAFSVFLDLISLAHKSESIYKPLGRHFATHTARMWEDVTDYDGNILLNRVYRLENLESGISEVFRECGIDQEVKMVHKNKRPRDIGFSPDRSQKKRIRELFAEDFELYENAR